MFEEATVLEADRAGSPSAAVSRPAPRPATTETTTAEDGREGYCDPFEDDCPRDVPFLISERRLVRLATVATETGARFAREGIAHDPVAWLLTPNVLFDGERAVDACQDRLPFVRATLLHGLGFGLEASPEEIDAVLSADAGGIDGAFDVEEGPGVVPDAGDPSARLFVATIEGRIGMRGVRALTASVCSDGEAARRRLAVRFGERLAGEAVIVEGFDPASPVARALLSDETALLLCEAAFDPAGAAADGLDLHVEQRFAL